MNLLSKTAVVAVLTACSASVFAAGLTPQQCNDYPFKPVTGQITHAQLQQELAELEAVGYDPSANTDNYPSDIDTAEHKLRAEYRADCLPAQGSSNAAMNPAQGTPAS